MQFNASRKAFFDRLQLASARMDDDELRTILVAVARLDPHRD